MADTAYLLFVRIILDDSMIFTILPEKDKVADIQAMKEKSIDVIQGRFLNYPGQITGGYPLDIAVLFRNDKPTVHFSSILLIPFAHALSKRPCAKLFSILEVIRWHPGTNLIVRLFFTTKVYP